MNSKDNLSEFWWDILRKVLTSTIYEGPMKKKVSKKMYLILNISGDLENKILF